MCIAALAQEPTISVTTRLVEVSVVAQDKKGRPVADLAQSDFEVLEDGIRQDIRLFLRNSPPNGAAAASLPPGVFSNRGGGTGGASARLSVVLFDALNTPWQYRNYAGRHVDQFVKSAAPDERVVVLLLSTEGLRLLHNDRRYQMPQFRSDGLLSKPESTAEAMQADRYTDERVRVTLRAMEIIAQHLAGTPGRKNLIWVTGGIPRQLNMYEPPGSLRDKQSYTAEYAQATRALNRSGVSVYTVDARGLEAFAVRGQPEDLMKAQQYREGMRDLAVGTGGRSYFDRNDLGRVMTEAAEDARTSYTLAYYQPGEFNGKWRRIQVRVKRDGVTVRHRAGYLALDYRGDAEDEFRRAMASPLDATAIGMTGKVEKQPDGTWRAMVQIDPGSISFVPQGNAYRCRLEMVTMVRDSSSRLLGKQQIDRLDRVLEGKALREVQENGILFRREFAVGPTAFDVRFAVRDPITGLIATLSMPLTAR